MKNLILSVSLSLFTLLTFTACAHHTTTTTTSYTRPVAVVPAHVTTSSTTVTRQD